MPHSYRTVLLERHPAGYAVVTLNRPEKLNALSMELRRELVAALEELQRDPAVRVLVLTGAGRAFCAGLDLNELSQTSANSARAFELDPVAALLQFAGPVIGAINGVAATGGFELAMTCDVLLASTQAQFADTHAKVGLRPAGASPSACPAASVSIAPRSLPSPPGSCPRPKRRLGASSIAWCRRASCSTRPAPWRKRCSRSCRRCW
jgi:enoyl-CoA hydratase/carnithine racemase